MSTEESAIELITGKDRLKKKSRIPARLDFLQSATGLILALFMIFHMLFVSTILISNDFMLAVTKAFELSFLFEGGSPVPVFIAIATIFVIFIVHAFLAMRKFPINYKEYQRLRAHAGMMGHKDTKLWMTQAATGFVLFFLGSIHLYTMLSNPGTIGPYASADRMWSDLMWPLYLLLLLAVEFHGAIGLYRLSVKWGWFDKGNGKESRVKLKKAKMIMTVAMLTLGLLSLAAYMKIGHDHKDNAGQRYMTEMVK